MSKSIWSNWACQVKVHAEMRLITLKSTTCLLIRQIMVPEMEMKGYITDVKSYSLNCPWKFWHTFPGLKLAAAIGQWMSPGTGRRAGGRRSLGHSRVLNEMAKSVYWALSLRSHSKQSSLSSKKRNCNHQWNPYFQNKLSFSYW
jgi:hypothetical protein